MQKSRKFQKAKSVVCQEVAIKKVLQQLKYFSQNLIKHKASVGGHKSSGAGFCMFIDSVRAAKLVINHQSKKRNEQVSQNFK